MSVGELVDRKERPAYVRFERIAVEDKAASAKEGHYVAKDVDMALITPPYSKDVFKIKVPQWIANMKQDVQNGRLPEKWMEDYIESYNRWKKGEEIPLNGIAIKGWGVISPAQQETLIKMNVLTVEDLAGINDEGIKRVGMGGMDLKNKAVAWLSQLKDKGPLTQEIAAVKSENVILKSSVESLQRQVTELLSQFKAQQGHGPQAIAEQVEQETGISSADLLDTEDLSLQYERKFGKKPHHLMKPETIQRALLE